MLVGVPKQDMKRWQDQMYSYQKGKRTKKPFGKDFSPISDIVKSQQIRQKQTQFNPVLQSFSSEFKQLQQKLKQEDKRTASLNHYFKTVGKRNMRDFDIINLHGNTSIDQKPSSKLRAPIRNIYNPINNQPLPKFYLQGQDVRLNEEKNFKNLKPTPRDFDIVTGKYHVDHEQKYQKEIQKQCEMVHQKYERTHDYDPVFGKYYSPEKQSKYLEDLKKDQFIQMSGEIYNKRYPPTYIKRQPLVLDPSKPLSQSLIEVDTRKQNAKQRYKMKYLIEQQYERRNIEDEERRQAMIRNRVYNSHSTENKAKQFNLQNLSQMKNELANQLFVVKQPKQGWNRLQFIQNPQRFGFKIYSNRYNESQRQSELSSQGNSGRGQIKSGGFY